MQPEAQKYLFDIEKAARRIDRFTVGLKYEHYYDSELLQSAVERQFLIIGEALLRVVRVDDAIAERITGYRQIIGFRNVLAHDYGDVQIRVVWDALETHLPTLRAEVEALLAEE